MLKLHLNNFPPVYIGPGSIINVKIEIPINIVSSVEYSNQSIGEIDPKFYGLLPNVLTIKFKNNIYNSIFYNLLNPDKIQNTTINPNNKIDIVNSIVTEEIIQDNYSINPIDFSEKITEELYKKEEEIKKLLDEVAKSKSILDQEREVIENKISSKLPEEIEEIIVDTMINFNMLEEIEEVIENKISSKLLNEIKKIKIKNNILDIPTENLEIDVIKETVDEIEEVMEFIQPEILEETIIQLDSNEILYKEVNEEIKEEKNKESKKQNNVVKKEIVKDNINSKDLYFEKSIDDKPMYLDDDIDDVPLYRENL